DGVGNACDPLPTTAGEIQVFDSFFGANGAWVTGGTWTAGNDSVTAMTSAATMSWRTLGTGGRRITMSTHLTPSTLDIVGGLYLDGHQDPRLPPFITCSARDLPGGVMLSIEYQDVIGSITTQTYTVPASEASYTLTMSY